MKWFAIMLAAGVLTLVVCALVRGAFKGYCLSSLITIFAIIFYDLRAVEMEGYLHWGAFIVNGMFAILTLPTILCIAILYKLTGVYLSRRQQIRVGMAGGGG